MFSAVSGRSVGISLPDSRSVWYGICIMGLDFDKVAPKLYVGSAPTMGVDYARLGFDCLVLCAAEYQPISGFGRVRIIHAPMGDDRDPMTIRRAQEAAQAALGILQAGGRVLVTCRQGRNRSGLVAALTLWQAGCGSGSETADQIRENRRAVGVLNNPYFSSVLDSLPRFRAPSRQCG